MIYLSSSYRVFAGTSTLLVQHEFAIADSDNEGADAWTVPLTLVGLAGCILSLVQHIYMFPRLALKLVWARSKELVDTKACKCSSALTVKVASVFCSENARPCSHSKIDADALHGLLEIVPF